MSVLWGWLAGSVTGGAAAVGLVAATHLNSPVAGFFIGVFGAGLGGVGGLLTAERLEDRHARR